MMGKQPRPHHLALCTIFQNLYKQMMEPNPGLWFHSIERHALPALVDGFIREYKKEWYVVLSFGLLAIGDVGFAKSGIRMSQN